MASIKSLAAIRTKWLKNTPQAQSDYEAGVRAPKADWATQTVAAKDNYAAGVQAAIGDDRFARGVADAGTDKWRKKALAVGGSRFGQGVREAGDDYQNGFRPYHDVIAATTLPPRGPKGDPRNIERVSVLATALHQRKISGG